MILWKRLFHNICIDKMKALFPIKKEYVKKIFDGSKAYEYRKSFCSLEVDTIVSTNQGERDLLLVSLR